MYGRKESLKSRWFGCQKCSVDKVGIFYPTALPTVKMRVAKGLVKLTIECFFMWKITIFHQLKTFFHSKYLLLPHLIPFLHIYLILQPPHPSSLMPHPFIPEPYAFIPHSHHSSFIPHSTFSILHSSFLISHPSSLVLCNNLVDI